MKRIYLIFALSFITLFCQAQTYESVTYFMVDGLSNDRFSKLLAEEKLPNIKSMVDHGLYVKQGIVSFPSMTGYGFYPFLTGVDASESEILGLRWLDRDQKGAHFRNYVGRTNIHMNQDIRDDVKLIFEYFGEEDKTISINTYCNRGVTENVNTGFSHVTSKYDTDQAFGRLEDFPIIGRRLFKDIHEFERNVQDIALEQLNEDPKVHWITLASPDARNHVHGTDEIYDQLIIDIDKIIGRYISKSKVLGQNRLFAFISDHGVRDVKYNLRPEKSLEERTGVKLHRGAAANMFSLSLAERDETYIGYDGKYVVNGNLSAFIYLRSNNEWLPRLYESDLRSYKGKDIIKTLIDLEGIGMILYRGDGNSYKVESKLGTGEIFTRGELISYKTVDEDPLDYAFDMEQQLSFDKFQHMDLVLEMSANTEYPGALERIINILDKENSPDLVLLSSKDYDLAEDYEPFVKNYKGGHGGIHKDCLSVPFILYGQDMKTSQVSIMRSEDFGKMIFRYLDIDLVEQ